MKRFLLFCLLFGAASSLLADENVRTIQVRLKEGGFYSGEINGVFNSDTAAAVTRYQIRNGLQITGKLDAQTSHALGVSAVAPQVPTPKFGEDVWRYLRKSDQEHIKKIMAEDAGSTQRRQVTESSTPPATNTSAQRKTAKARPRVNGPSSYDSERLRDYIAAFVLAGLDPRVGAEAEFFADRVEYFGEHNVTREKIRRDLQRYDNHWPERGFSLKGELAVTPVKDRLQVAFLLRYELRSGSRHSSGKVWKTLVLEKTGADDLQIVSVNERKAR
ncbi:MAG: peptidoglycan-binding protein [Verrucomicrobiota bacterium]|nr:peptidoglycan-binding protein [Verrucomicrobiota bacterium]